MPPGNAGVITPGRLRTSFAHSWNVFTAQDAACESGIHEQRALAGLGQHPHHRMIRDARLGAGVARTLSRRRSRRCSPRTDGVPTPVGQRLECGRQMAVGCDQVREQRVTAIRRHLKTESGRMSRSVGAVRHGCRKPLLSTGVYLAGVLTPPDRKISSVQASPAASPIPQRAIG